MAQVEISNSFPRWQSERHARLARASGWQQSVYEQENEFANVNLLIASVSGQLILSGSKVTGMLNMDGLKVGSLHMD